MARRSIVHAITGRTPDEGTLIVALAIVTLIAVLADRRRASVLILAALFAAGVALQMQMGARLQSDGFYYFAYLRSLAFDRDVDFTNDYRMLGLADKTNLFQATATGHAQSAWTIGPALVWAPFFAAGHLVATRLHASGAEVSTDGTSYPYRQAICIASLIYGLIGCWWCYRLSGRFFPRSIAAASVVLVVSGSFMLWYLVKEPTMTHASSMAAVAGFILAWAATRDRRTLAQWALLGLLAGFMSLLRWQNVLFALLPGWDATLQVARAVRSRNGSALRATAAAGVIFLVALVVGFAPQMLAWKSIYGSYIARSPVGPEIRWFQPHIVDILWSARNGLLSTSPVLYLAAVGLVGFAIARPAVGLPALAAVTMMTYFNACIQDWWGSAGFGGRRFDGTIPLFCIGLAAFVDYAAAVVRRRAVAVVAAACGLLAIGNLALIGAAQAGDVRIGETLAFDRAWAAQARVFHHWFGDPFSYPASLVFALRNHVSPGDYDLLSANRFLADPLQPYGRLDIGADDEWLVAEGWHAPEHEGPISFRWTSASAALRLTLDHASPLRVQVRLHALSFPAAAPQTLTLAANGHPCAPMPVTSAWQTVECVLGADAWRSGVNRLSLAFAWEKRPVDVGLGADPRSLAAAVDYVRVVVP